METTRELQVVNIEDYAMTPEKIQGQVNIIQKVMNQVMKKSEHYGVIPGCGNKPTLLKPGAEKLSVTFRLAPSYKIQKTELKDGHREYEVVCTLTHISSSLIVGQGVGSCSTMEGKFRFRKANQKCPKCGKDETIIKGKQEYGGGWICYGKKGGCGAKFKDGDPEIENHNMGRIEHDNPADYYNTVLKMAKKRAHVDAVLTATAASDIFTQDIEDMPEVIPGAGDNTELEQQKTRNQKTTTPKSGDKMLQADFEAILKLRDKIDETLTDGDIHNIVAWYNPEKLRSKAIELLNPETFQDARDKWIDETQLS